MAPEPSNPILLYDGVCGLCNRFVRFVLRRDRSRSFRFASLQSDFAADTLKRHHLDPLDLDSVYVIENAGSPDERLAVRSDAVIAVLQRLGGGWRLLGILLRLLPGRLRDWGYRLVAAQRYRIFGKYETCPLPEAKYRNRFLDL